MFGDFVGEKGASTGTGDYSMGGTAGLGSTRTWRSRFADGAIVGYLATTRDAVKREVGWGEFSIGTPDTLERNVVASTQADAAVDWDVTDTYYIYSVPLGFVLAAMANGGLGNSLPGWAQPGWGRLDDTDAAFWIAKRLLEDGETESEEGRHYIAAAIFAASQRTLFVDKGVADYVFTAADIGKTLCFDTTAALRVLTMMAHDVAGMGHGAYVYVQPYGSSSNGVTFTPGGSDTTDLATAPPGRRTLFIWDGAKSKWRSDYVTPAAIPAAPAYAGRRQTVAAGPVSTAGLPTFLPSTSGSLSLTTQNVTGSAPLVASAAGGWSASTGEPIDTVGYSSANLTWNGLTASRAAATPNFLYATIAGGVLTPASTILAPIYQFGGTPAVTSGQITFNIGEMKAYLGNGTTAPATALVVFGEAATDGSGVISTVAYAYNGRYESAWTNTLPSGSTAVTANHNLGVSPARADFAIENITTELTYAVGDRIAVGLATQLSSTAIVPYAPWSNAKQVGIVTGDGGSGTTFAMSRTSPGSYVALTNANWKYRFAADRGWG